MIDTDNMISVEEDDRITAEEAAKSDSELLWEALRMLTAANDRLINRVEKLERLAGIEERQFPFSKIWPS